MTTRVETIEYAHRATTYGSAAYDLNPLRRGAFAPPYEIPTERPAEKPEAIPQTKTKTKTREKRDSAQSLSMLSIAGFVLAAALLVLSLLANVQLTDVSAQTTQLQAQLSALEEEEKQLLIAYENTFNLTEVERYATGVVGMSRASEDQVITLNTEKADKAVILEDETPSFGEKVKGVVSFLSSLMEYFK